MSQLSPILRNDDNNGLEFWCPGCNMPHRIRYGDVDDGPCWLWDGDITLPTITPSIVIRWSKGNPSTAHMCHSLITNGQITFLDDCTHALVGQVLALPDWPI